MDDILVSIVVISYNSEKTILDTLNSIFYQTYSRIELIISDDCSADRTVELAEKWIEKNKRRFEKVLVNKNKENLGISKNINQGLQLTSGIWIKSIAADDILLPECVELNLNYVIENRINTVLYSNIILFKQNDNLIKYFDMEKEEKNYIEKFSKKESKNQYQDLLRRDILVSPTIFIKREFIEKIGGYDERIRNIEDWPLKIKISQQGYKIYYMPKTTVLYRIGESVSHSETELFKIAHIQQKRELKESICYPNISKSNIVYYLQEIIIRIKEDLLINHFGNRRNKITIFINRVSCLIYLRTWKKILRFEWNNTKEATLEDIYSQRIKL